jgi:carbamoyltransferase
MAQEVKRITGARNLCLAGGVALNCVANGKLLREGLFDHLYIQPAAGDAGGALGAALAAHHLYFEQPRENPKKRDLMQGAFLGPSFSEKEIERMSKKAKAVFTRYDDFDELAVTVAGHIAEGKVVGWFQGRMEFGPRALGNRSILADARDPAMQQKLNQLVKHRESFRPFAPAVLLEEANAYFDLPVDSPYMLLTATVREDRRNPRPKDFDDRSWQERLHASRSEIPAVTHLDFSARVQTVSRDTNPRFWRLIDAFRQQTGCAVLVNTSFNVRGEPIVCEPGDAYRCFMSTGLDYLVINDFLFRKTDQPDWQDEGKWSMEFKKD